MMISVEHNFLFVHVNKVAGNSIVEALRRMTLDRAARTNIRLDEIAQAVGTRLQRRTGLNVRIHNPFYKDKYKFVPKHISASEIRKLIGADYYDKLYKFAFVRNPWDRVVSRYHYARGHGSHKLYDEVSSMRNFEEYVEWAVAETKPFLQTNVLCDEDGSILVDFVGRFESLADDFSTVCNRIGLPQPSLQHLNPSQKRESRSYRKYYSERARALIAEFCRKDIETFGYEF
jgi:hypothetical protein